MSECCRNILTLECDYNQRNEDVDEEERKDYEEHDVKQGDFDSKERRWTSIFFCRVHWILTDTRPSFSGGYNKQG